MPAYMLGSDILSKDEKILAMSMMSLASGDIVQRDIQQLVRTTALSKEEILTALEKLEKRELIKSTNDEIIISWGFECLQ
jgi:hypothetical protein